MEFCRFETYSEGEFRVSYFRTCKRLFLVLVKDNAKEFALMFCQQRQPNLSLQCLILFIGSVNRKWYV